MAYVTVQDLRNEGVSDPPYNDACLERRIAIAQDKFEQLTGRVFEKQEALEVRLDGTGHELLRLSQPLVNTSAISSLTVDSEEVDAETYEVIQPRVPDGRFYPKLRHLTSIWPQGRSNIVIVGDFGFVDPSGEAPAMVKEAIMRIVVRGLPNLADVSAQQADRVIREKLKDYEYQLSEIGKGGYFGDPKIDNAISHFSTVSMAAV